MSKTKKKSRAKGKPKSLYLNEELYIAVGELIWPRTVSDLVNEMLKLALEQLKTKRVKG